MKLLADAGSELVSFAVSQQQQLHAEQNANI